MSTHPEADPYYLDPVAVRRAFNRAATTHDAAAALQKEVRERLLERLDFVRLKPAHILDLGAATGHASAALASRYPDATVVAVDVAENLLVGGGELTANDRLSGVCADAVALPFASASMDLIFCNLMLHWCNDPLQVFAECRRVLRPGGLLNLSSLGPDTLYEMRAAWAGVDQAIHVNRFQDMHNVGDGMLKVGLAEPVLDTEYFTLTYKTVPGIMRDLKNLGGNNVTQGRPRGLGSRECLDKVSAAYEQFRDGDHLPVTYEVVYGQAWGRSAEETSGLTGNEARIPMSRIGWRQSGDDS